jgi:hypothetical protein
MIFLQATEIIGKKIDINLDGLMVPVKILDVKTAYGRVSAGLNSKWIDASRVG